MKPIHAGLVGLALLAGCNNDNVMAATERAYNQIQRLGNPLVSEVFLAKRSHPVHGATGPAQDAALISAELKAFVANVAGRNATVQNTLAAVLLPDELIVQTDKDPGTAGILVRLDDQLVWQQHRGQDRKSTRLNSSHLVISYAVFCLKK